MPAPNEFVSSIVLSVVGIMVLAFVAIPMSLTLGTFNIIKRAIGNVGTRFGLISERRLDYKVKDPKCILITGASHGIGAALAMEFADKHKTLILCARHEGPLKEIQKACQLRDCENVITLTLDVSDRENTVQTLKRLDEEHNIDLVIANAGVTADRDHHPIEKEGLDGVSRMLIETNVLGVMYTIAPIIEGMKKRGHGQVAIMGSIVGLFGTTAMPIYAATKSFLQSLSRDLVFPLYYKYGVHLSLIAPGFVESRMTHVLKDDAQAWYPWLLFWGPQQSAKYIRKCLVDNQYYIPFPWYFELIQYSAYVLPPPLQPYISSMVGYSGVTGTPSREALCLT
ncbi:hypothetical protein SeLEV6574_g05419 [Synchytrium endobioticum]|nr:hypothetical protein SeLEV6574_g05419 [Synchytrium endobioticum]